MTRVFRTMIVSAAVAPLARAIPSGVGMFAAAYSATGAEPATHFASEGWIGEEFAAGLETPEALVEMLAAAGAQMTLPQAQGLLSQAVVSDRPAAEVLAEMGLQPVVPEGV